MSENAYGPGEGPSARILSEEEAVRILGAQRFGVLATVRRDGHPHLASMAYVWDPGEGVLRFSSAEGRIKALHLARDPRATLHVQGENVLSYALAEGNAEVSPPSTTPGDPTGRTLLRMAGGFPTPSEKAAFLTHMATHHRLVITLRPTRLSGTALDGPPN